MLRSRLLHEGWQFAAARWLPEPQRLAFSPLEWLPARVPGYVHLDLQRESVIADPLARRHELGVQWVDEEDWSYRCEFLFEPDPERPRRVLRFQGLDTIATVFLNGEEVARSDDMFLPLEVDVSERLRAGSNSLLVEFASAPRVGRERRERYLEREGLPFDVERFDERAFVRKAQFMFGWDWGPRLTSVGVWQPVELLEYQARLEDVTVEQRHLDDGSVELCVRATCDGEGKVVHRLERGTFHAEFDDGQTLRVEQPERWWPLGLGAPALYTLTTELLATNPRGGRAQRLDTQVRRIGLRTIELRQQPDEHGTSFEFIVNGVPLWALGANWIPDHSFPTQVTRERLAAQLDRARELGMNMLRIWGGGVYESEDFYDLCDERGLLVWQDFPFACNYAPDDETAQRAVRVEASWHIRRLRHRASLALWCGNNENLTMFETKWGRAEHHPPRYYGERIWNGTLPELVAALDAGRAYVPTSPFGGPNANADAAGDQHNWDVWHGRGDWCHYRDSRGRFVSEFGFASAPGRRAWASALDAHDGVDAERAPVRLESLPPSDATARWHDKTMKGYETFTGYVELHYPASQSIADWTYYSQLNQRDAMRFALEHYRGGTFCRGTLIWQLNDCWPVQSWALIDFAGEYKAAAFELRRLFAPALCCVEIAGANARLRLALDNTQVAREVVLHVLVTQLADGAVLLQQEHRQLLSPGERREVSCLELAGLDPNRVLLTVEVDGHSSSRTLGEPKHARLRLEPLTARFRDGAVELECTAPLVDAFAFCDDGSFLPEANYLSLPRPGTLRFRCSSRPLGLRVRSLAGEHPIDWR